MCNKNQIIIPAMNKNQTALKPNLINDSTKIAPKIYKSYQ